MPPIEVILFKEDDNTVPLIDWLNAIPPKARAKCVGAIRRLESLGHELRRPEADYLRDGIYELRIGLQGGNYRIPYFFHEKTAAVLTHGLVKERAVPAGEIEEAIRRKRRFEQAPKPHTYEET